MSAEASEPVKVDPQQQLIRYLRTSINYCHRQGLSFDAMAEVLHDVAHPRPRKPYDDVEFPKLEMVDKGVNDMRDRMSN